MELMIGLTWLFSSEFFEPCSENNVTTNIYFLILILAVTGSFGYEPWIFFEAIVYLAETKEKMFNSKQLIFTLRLVSTHVDFGSQLIFLYQLLLLPSPWSDGTITRFFHYFKPVSNIHRQLVFFSTAKFLILTSSNRRHPCLQKFLWIWFHSFWSPNQ